MDKIRENNFCKDISYIDFWQYEYDHGFYFERTMEGMKETEKKWDKMIDFAIKYDYLIKMATEYGYSKIESVRLCYSIACDQKNYYGFPDKWTERQLREKLEKFNRIKSALKTVLIDANDIKNLEECADILQTINKNL